MGIQCRGGADIVDVDVSDVLVGVVDEGPALVARLIEERAAHGGDVVPEGL
jgi:hypothetical protein